MSGTGGQIDSNGILNEVSEPSLADQCHAAWALVGVAAGSVRDRAHADVADVLGMLGVTAADVLKHRPRVKRGRRRVHVRDSR